MQMLGTDDVRGAIEALQSLEAQGPATAAGLDQAEAATRQAADAAKSLAAANREELEAIRAATAAATAAASAHEAVADASAEVNAMLARSGAAAESLAQAERDAANAAEMLAAAERHEAEMARAAAAADREEVEAIRQVTAADQQLVAANQAVAAASARVNAAFDAEAAEAQQLTLALGAEANAMWATDAAQNELLEGANRAGDATGKLGASGVTVGKGMGSLQQSIIAGSYAFQDFTATSGDLGAKLNSVSNNLPGLLVGLGGLGVALSVGATAGIAIYRNWDSIAGLWETRNPFPKAADDVAGMKRELDAAKDALEKMDKAGSGNADQLARYNELRATTVRLEREIADEQERQSRLKTFLEKPDEATVGRGKAYQEANVGRGQEQLTALEEAERREAEAQIKAEEGRMNRRVETYLMGDHNIDEEQAFLREQADRFKAYENAVRSADFGEAARKLNDRLIQGDATAGKALDRLMDSFPTLFIGLKDKLDALDPNKQKAQKELVEQLNKQGEEGEKEALAQAKAIQAEKERNLKAQLDAMVKIGGIDKAADELRAQAERQGMDTAQSFEFVRTRLQEAIGGGLEMRGVKVGKGPSAQVDAAARQAADRALGRGVAAEKKEEKGEETALTAEARANKARIDAEVKRINAVVGSSYKQQFEQTMATNAGNAAMGRPSEDPAVLRKRLEGQMTAAMRRRGADEQSANLAAKGIGEAGTTDLARQFESKAGTVAQKNLQIAADHNRLFAAVIGQLNGVAARQGTVERQTGELLRSINPRAHHQRRKGQP
jgi:hypothetical protein